MIQMMVVVDSIVLDESGVLIDTLLDTGPLVVRGSSITSLECFIQLTSVNAGSSLFEHEGGRYAVAIYGMAVGLESLQH